MNTHDITHAPPQSESSKLERREKLEATARQLATHEVGHGFMVQKLGGTIFKYVFDLEVGTGRAYYQRPRTLVSRDRALIIIGGYAAEVVEFGIDALIGRGSKGLYNDSMRLNSLGFDTQDKKAELLIEAMEIIQAHKTEFQKMRDEVEQSLKNKLRYSDYTPTVFPSG